MTARLPEALPLLTLQQLTDSKTRRLHLPVVFSLAACEYVAVFFTYPCFASGIPAPTTSINC